MFDLTSKRIIASEIFDYDGGDFSYDHNAGTGIKVRLTNLYYNDENPDVIIVGAANVKGRRVKQYQVTETTDGGEKITRKVDGDFDLADVLTDDVRWSTDPETGDDVYAGVMTISDYVNIVVDAASCENPEMEEYPLMSGVYSVSNNNTNFNNSHGNFTMDPEGNISFEEKANDVVIDVVWTLFTKEVDRGDGTIPGRFRTLDFRSKTLNKKAGIVHLRRLVSKISVEITTAPGITADITNGSFQVYNVPRGVFFQERTMVTNISSYDTKAKWLAATAAAADLLDDGYYNSNAYGPGDFGTEDGFEVKEDEALRTDNGTIKFSYWHYENKHWGLAGITDYHQREQRFPGAYDVFSSLCPSPDRDWNNNAGYLVLRLHVTDKNNGLEGDVEYLIHEGYCCKANSARVDEVSQAAVDFATFRNTNYLYKIQIAGIESIRVEAQKEGEPNPGTSGEVWATSKTEQVNVVEEGGDYEVLLPDGELYWIIDSNGQKFGKSIPVASSLYSINGEQWASISAGATLDGTIPTDNDFYNGITVNGRPLGEYVAAASRTSIVDTPATIRFSGDNTGDLYLCQSMKSEDGHSTYRAVVKYSQFAGKLTAPVVTMPGVTGNNVVLGVDDHTLVWKRVNGADSYTIRLAQTGIGGGYYVTLSPGEEKTDAEFLAAGLASYTIKLEEDGANLRFTMRYAKSVGSLMSLVDTDANLSASATFEVIAHRGSESSEAGTLTKTVINPYWDFNTAAWQNAVRTTIGSATGTFAENTSVSVNGLEMFAGNSAKMEYNKYGNYYAFRPNGGSSNNYNNRTFRFRAFANGRVDVWTSSTGGAGTGRYACVAELGASGTPAYTITATSVNANGTASGTQTKITGFNIDPLVRNSATPNTCVFNTQDILIYRVQFTPQDRDTNTHQSNEEI